MKKTVEIGRSRLRDFVWVGCAAITYFIVALICLHFIIKPQGIAAIWFPSGIFLSALLLSRPGLRFYVIILFFIAGFLAELQSGTPGQISLFYASVQTGDAVLSAWLLLRFIADPFTFLKIRNLFGFVLFSVCMSNLFMSLIGAGISSLLFGPPFFSSLKWWFFPNTVGNILVTPMLVSWISMKLSDLKSIPRIRYIEAIAILVMMSLSVYLVLYFRLAEVHVISTVGVIFIPFLTWAAVRFGIRAVSVFAFLLTILFILERHFTGSPLWSTPDFNTLILFEILISVVTITALFLASAIFDFKQEIRIRKSTEETLKISEEKYRITFKTIPDATVFTRIDGMLVEINDGFTLLTGYLKEEAVGQNLLDLNVYVVREDRTRLVTALKKSGTVTNFETRIQCKDQTLKTVLISASMITIMNSTYILSVLRDISDRKVMEEVLKNSKNKAEESSRLKTSLLLNMSHELRTPLNGILGFTGLLKETLESQEQKEMADLILLSSKRLMATLNSIMELADIESNQMRIRVMDVNISQLTSSLIKKHASLFESKKIVLIEQIENNIYSKIDENLFSNLLFHLIDNAVKFTVEGSVTVIVKKEFRKNLPVVVVSIKDTGIGISPAQISFIFEAFRQGNEGINRSHEGSGLGLTLCKKFTALMGGEIEVESTPGSGTTFSVIFPVSRMEPDLTEIIPAAIPDLTVSNNHDKPRILVVEDNLAISSLIKLYLKSGFIADQVENGALSVKMARLKKYDLILMDINLGQGLDGIESLKEIRKLPNYSKTPIIAVSTYSTEREKQHFKNEGFDEFLEKPFDKEMLTSMIRKFLK